MRSKDSNADNEDGRPADDTNTEIVEALMDDGEVVVDGFQRVSVFGLEVMMLDGPVRVRTGEQLERERRLRRQAHRRL